MRIVALSDQHGFLPDVPPCDLLIVAGDVCPDRVDGKLAHDHPERQKAWFDTEGRRWLATTPASHRLLTWGNHDWCGEAFDFDADAPANADSCGLQIVVDECVTVPMSGRSGSVSVWLTPWSNLFMHWAFMKPLPDLATLYAGIPSGIDILVTHQPPLGYGDLHDPAGTGRPQHLGNPDLLAAIDRIKPRLVVCGHIHGGHGRFDRKGTTIYNVSVVDDCYRLKHSPTIIDVANW
jgi:hypothetical protein